MNDKELFYRMALTRIPRMNPQSARNLLKQAGSATALFESKKGTPSLLDAFALMTGIPANWSNILRISDAELQFAMQHDIQCLTENDERYPSRLRECDDAPLVLYYQGNADLNNLHVISIIGTRNATEYGKEYCVRFMHELKELVPDALIVSGLAYGIDIHAHRAALDNEMETVGVLAHGLDRIYPSVHRDTARRMKSRGGLLTEFMSGTNPDKQNFIKRNRIVAGLCDATIVVESAAKGGALITAEIAGSYNRDCFAVPGRVSDTYSEGCNNLIRTNRAALLTHAEELVKAMNWDVKRNAPKAVQRQLFIELSGEEQTVYDLLRKHDDGTQINTLTVESNIAINRLTGILFELEMKGLIRALAGGVYRAL